MDTKMKRPTEPIIRKALSEQSHKVGMPRFSRRAQRRVGRLWSIWVQRLMNIRFPILGARLTSRQKGEIETLLQPGDILLKDNCGYPFSQLGARLLGSRWIHSAVFIGDGKVIDCGSVPYVAEAPLEYFLDASDVAIYRPRFKTAGDCESALRYLRDQIDKPFNKTFNLANKNSFYCTQLIYRMLKQMPNPIDLPVSSVGGRKAILARDIEDCTELQRVYLFRAAPWRIFIAHTPSFVALSLGASLAKKIRPEYGFFGGILGLMSILTITQQKCHPVRMRKT